MILEFFEWDALQKKRLSGYVHKYQTHFWGSVQNDPLLNFYQYIGAVK